MKPVCCYNIWDSRLQISGSYICTFPSRFEISFSARQGWCNALYKITKRFKHAKVCPWYDVIVDPSDTVGNTVKVTKRKH